MNTTANPGAQGACEPRFDAVRRVFEEQVASGREVGAAVAVTLDGDPIVDLWGGFADQARTTPWDRDTMVNVYSTTKGVTAICAHRLVDEGRLELDAPVARYWPEFAQAGKAEIPVRWLLSHRSGLPAVREPLPGEALYSWGAMTAALAAQEPWWTPGTRRRPPRCQPSARRHRRGWCAHRCWSFEKHRRRPAEWAQALGPKR